MKLNTCDTIYLKSNKSSYSYKEVDLLSNEVADYLDNKKSNQFVAIDYPESPEAVIMIWGVLKSGRAYVFVYGEKNKDKIYHKLEVNCVLKEFKFSPRRSYPLKEGYYSHALLSSGTTADPKILKFKKESLKVFIEWTSSILKENKLISLNPFSFDLSLLDIFYTNEKTGTLFFPDVNEKLFPRDLKKYLEHVTILYSTPSRISQLARGKILNSVKELIFAGERIPEETLKLCLSDEKVLYNFYGPSETNVVLYKKIESYKDLEVLDQTPFYVEKLEFKDNELWVNSQSNYENFFNQLYPTGDIFQENKFQGRRDHQIKHMGYRINLESLKKMLESYHSIFSLDYDKKEKKFILSSPDIDDLKKTVKKYFPNYISPIEYKYKKNILSKRGKS